MKTPALLSCRIALAAVCATGSSVALAKESGANAAGADEAGAVAPVALAQGVNAARDARSLDAVDASAFTLAASAPSAGEDTINLAAQGSQSGGGAGGGSGSGRSGFQLPNIVFDDTWATVGIGAGLVPSYGGSDDYIIFPLPLVAGRVGGIGISPNGPGFALDLFSPGPALGGSKPRFFGGPAFRIRNDRAQQIEDEVVELAEDLDWAVEVGAQAGVSFPGVFNPLDSLTLTAQVRWTLLARMMAC